MRTTRGMSRMTMSHAAMRAASALSETRCDEPRDVIETARHPGPRFGAACARWSSDLGHLAVVERDGQIGRPAARTGADAVARWTRVRRVGGEPDKGSRCGTAFRWIYLSVALYRRLPADPGILELWLHLPCSAVLCLYGARRSFDNRDIRARTLSPRARRRPDCGAVARVLTCFYRLF